VGRIGENDRSQSRIGFYTLGLAVATSAIECSHQTRGSLSVFLPSVLRYQHRMGGR
jgi:hypothetical protein